MKFRSELCTSKLARKLLRRVYLAFLQKGTLIGPWQAMG